MLQLRGTGDPKILYFIADEVFLGSSSTWTSLRTKLFHFPPGPDSATPPLSSSFFGWEGRLWRGMVFRLLPWLAFTLASSQTRDLQKAFSGFCLAKAVQRELEAVSGSKTPGWPLDGIAVLPVFLISIHSSSQSCCLLPGSLHNEKQWVEPIKSFDQQGSHFRAR